MRYQVKRVKGAQAEMALSLGLVKIARSSAKDLFDLGVPLVLVGNNVNDYHFFGGQHLATRVDSQRIKDEGWDLDKYVNNWAYYNEQDQGTPAFFVEVKHVVGPSTSRGGKGRRAAPRKTKSKKSTRRAKPATLEFDVSLMVEDYVTDDGDPDYAFEDAAQDRSGALRAAREDVKTYVPRHARRIRIARAEFQEFDAANYTHAGAHWLATATGPRDALEALAQKLNKEYGFAPDEEGRVEVEPRLGAAPAPASNKGFGDEFTARCSRCDNPTLPGMRLCPPCELELEGGGRQEGRGRLRQPAKRVKAKRPARRGGKRRADVGGLATAVARLTR